MKIQIQVHKTAFTLKQEYIPIGCGPSAAVAIGGGLCLGRGVSAQWGVSSQGGVHLPPVDRQTPVKTFAQLLLRMVII